MDNNKYLLIEVIERVISVPARFPTYEEAYEEMRRRYAQATDIDLDNPDPDELERIEEEIQENSAYTERHGQNFDWQLFHETDGKMVPARKGTEESISGDDSTHKCHSEPTEGTRQEERFIALVACCAVRDVQICSKSDCDPSDEDSWYDADDVEVYLGEFSGPDALEKAAEHGCTDPANIQLIPIGSP